MQAQRNTCAEDCPRAELALQMKLLLERGVTLRQTRQSLDHLTHVLAMLGDRQIELAYCTGAGGHGGAADGDAGRQIGRPSPAHGAGMAGRSK